MEFKRKTQKQNFGNRQRPSSHSEQSESWLEEVDEKYGDLKERVKRQAAQDVARNRYHPSPRPKPLSGDPEKVELNIKLQVPKIDVQKIKQKFNPVLKALGAVKDAPANFKNSSTKQKSFVILAACLLVGGTVAFKVLTKDDLAEVQGTATSGTDENPVSHDPKFDIVLPEGREIPKESIAYNSNKNFAKYDDQINTFKVSVSQQPLPESFKADKSGSVQKMAEAFGAKEKLSLGDQDMFYGRQEKGPETLILTKKDVIIFIQTVQPIGKESLKAYAFNLN